MFCQYGYLMRLILVLLALVPPLVGQMASRRISPDEAAKHLIEQPPALYPAMAQAGRIQGHVILEVTIDESGKASVRRLVMGHPLLAPAAIQSVNGWRYRPFEVDGKPAAVVSLAVVTFGAPGKEHGDETRAELLFQNNFWTLEESASVALAKGDFTVAEQQLNKAKDLLAPAGDLARGHESEQWQWTISMGRLAMARQKYDDAEQYYRKAQEFHQSDKDAPEIAATLAELGKLYAEEKRYDLARDHATRSVAIYKKDFRRVSSGHSGARQVYGRAIANQSWMLSKIAVQQNDKVEAARQCREVLDFETFLDAADHDRFVSACEQLAGTTKN